MTSAERRLFGASRLHKNTNARHRALLRKALEVVPDRELEVMFGQPTHLRVVMGTALGFFQMGKITSNFLRDGRVVYRETEIPDLAVREALRAYLAAYDGYFMKRGDDYIVRNPHARAEMQAAEQRWHNFIVTYLAARGRPQRPGGALEPLLGLDRVHVPRATAHYTSAIASASPSSYRSPHSSTKLPHSRKLDTATKLRLVNAKRVTFARSSSIAADTPDYPECCDTHPAVRVNSSRSDKKYKK
ncbi:hypothetical protein DFH07DRAFT_781948 [Mycena maculata]|uniref:Uncharacterized protein n=1 Tax=Mycena maculata TaxID=230809 RepID=A0AAD7HX97_9AGAR|nr:hypothetical protein DFH07DRAFT_781948 [Mycena maculata]